MEKMAVQMTYILALPKVQRDLAFSGWQTATYLSTATHTVRYTDPVCAIKPT